MTEDQLTDHESEMVKRNAWCIVEDVVNKIHDEPGPGGSFMQAFKTNEPGTFKQIINCFLHVAKYTLKVLFILIYFLTIYTTCSIH